MSSPVHLIALTATRGWRSISRAARLDCLPECAAHNSEPRVHRRGFWPIARDRSRGAVISRRGTRSLVGTKALSVSGASADFFERLVRKPTGRVLDLGLAVG